MGVYNGSDRFLYKHVLDEDSKNSLFTDKDYEYVFQNTNTHLLTTRYISSLASRTCTCVHQDVQTHILLLETGLVFLHNFYSEYTKPNNQYSQLRCIFLEIHLPVDSRCQLDQYVRHKQMVPKNVESSKLAAYISSIPLPLSYSTVRIEVLEYPFFLKIIFKI